MAPEQRPGDLELIRDESADPDERVEAFDRLASAEVPGLRAVAAQWLASEDPYLRSWAVVNLLLYWHHDADVDTALAVLTGDPDPNVRHCTAAALERYVRHHDEHHEHRDRIVAALVRQLERDPEPSAQRSCYQQLLYILYPKNEWSNLPELTREFDRDRDVDWALLAPWRAQASEADRARRAAPPPPLPPSPETLRREQQRAHDLALLGDEQADPEERALAMLRRAKETFYADHDLGSLRSVAEGWLGHDEPWLRQGAVAALISYGGTDADIEAGLRLLAEDPSNAVRMTAAVWLEDLVSDDRALAPDVAPEIPPETVDRIATALVRQLEVDSDWQVQRACYDALVTLTVPRERRPDIPEDHFDRDRDVDWDLLAPWRTPPAPAPPDDDDDDAAPG